MDVPSLERVKATLESLSLRLEAVQQELQTETFTLADLRLTLPKEVRGSLGSKSTVQDVLRALAPSVNPQTLQVTMTPEWASVFQTTEPMSLFACVRSLTRFLETKN